MIEHPIYSKCDETVMHSQLKLYESLVSVAWIVSFFEG